MVALMIAAIMLGMVLKAFGSYSAERAAQQASYLFSRDLRLTRASAIRSRRSVSLVLDPATRVYTIRDAQGSVVITRVLSYGDLEVQSIDTNLPGDSVTFDDEGVADLGAATTGKAFVSSPSRTYVVEFNATGSSTIEEQ